MERKKLNIEELKNHLENPSPLVKFLLGALLIVIFIKSLFVASFIIMGIVSLIIGVLGITIAILFLFYITYLIVNFCKNNKDRIVKE